MHQSYFLQRDPSEGYTEESRRSSECAYPLYQFPPSASATSDSTTDGGEKAEDVPGRWDTLSDAQMTAQPYSPGGEIGSSGLPNIFGPSPPLSFHSGTCQSSWTQWEALGRCRGSDDPLAPGAVIRTSNLALPDPITGHDAKSPAASVDTCGGGSPHICMVPRIAKPVVASENVIGASARRRLPTNPEDLFRCTFPSCASTFTTRYNLNNHIKSHLGAKEHKCDYCSYEAVTKSDIRRHMKTCKFRTARCEVESHSRIR
ncbi:hypothetical protein VNI00_000789 [Paramarasmius palmivorus]|uniref:C2H2-type domain-containing protein n=1 Tax=Paramarasmius palmivorus TaxID=297713 RepID=A0AAW0EA89_9AGAR